MASYVGSKTELKRLLDMLPNTDPTSVDYSNLLRNIEFLSNLGYSMDEINVQIIEEEEPKPNIVKISKDYAIPDDTPEELVEEDVAPTDSSNEPQPTKEEIKALLTEFRRKTFVSIPNLLREHFGVESFGELPANEYANVKHIVEKLMEDT